MRKRCPYLNGRFATSWGRYPGQKTLQIAELDRIVWCRTYRWGSRGRRPPRGSPRG